MADAAALTVHVAWVDASQQVRERCITLPPGSRLQDALHFCGLTLAPHQSCGIWGRVQPLGYELQDGDRVELYQPLKVDPKVARRERFVRQGARGAGLFAGRRPNSKSGY